ncbi:uncharacterized protein BO88DRAFT_427226 [Aspergillus vadensis CBS 113365]|uniref:Uncharacterized protein n=1 Tax=Aspergillus vadensis (strain CBS 113365 / IMI 142717 / IBT 24658) TaxID=1448311 RepID=A0A319B5D9_ASPVC|nr:hypothetical protein BO88DRAFT_427226 [Aspergillus vadensis CBS 113365]PYH67014.1 hypothetical protein BO88DRAFT_427226 [Aspergillus vadensis CBS 113365]
MSDFNDRGQLVKRKYKDWAGPGLGHCDNDKMSKAVEPSQQPSKAKAPPLPTEALSKDEKVTSTGLAAETQAARLVALFRRLWELYITQNAKSSRLEKEISQMQITHTCLVNENTQLNCHCRDEEACLCHFRAVIQKLQKDIINVVKKWENFQMTEAPAAGGAEKPTQEKEDVAVIMSAVPAQED